MVTAESIPTATVCFSDRQNSAPGRFCNRSGNPPSAPVPLKHRPGRGTMVPLSPLPRRPSDSHLPLLRPGLPPCPVLPQVRSQFVSGQTSGWNTPDGVGLDCGTCSLLGSPAPPRPHGRQE